MVSNLEHKKDTEASEYSADAREASRNSHDTENQLSAQLITITLAFIALIAAAISTSNVLYVIADFQKFLILGAMIIFCFSILAGLINYFKNIGYHRKVSYTNESFADRAEDASSTTELDKIEDDADSARPEAKKQGRRSSVFLISQILLVFLGLVLTISFVGSLLFYTTHREDYIDELPIYDEIMDQSNK